MTNGPLPTSKFCPAWWLKNRHAQTIYSSIPLPVDRKDSFAREVLNLPDGDVAVVDWIGEGPDHNPDAPILIALPGLEGSSASSYARRILRMAVAQGWRAAVLNFRDCGGYRNRLPRRYHAGETVDIQFLIDSLQDKYHNASIVATGFSLGGNVLLKHLGESGDSTPLKGAVAVCAPLDLHDSSVALSTGCSRFYQWLFLRKMKKAIHRKFDEHTATFDYVAAISSKSFLEFDHVATAPVHGFNGKDDYYDSCSSLNFLRNICIPTLVLNSLDDPFMTPAVLPGQHQMSEDVELEVSSHGGHVGFVEGGSPWNPKFFLPGRIINYLKPLVA